MRMSENRETCEAFAATALHAIDCAYPHGELVQLSGPQDLQLPGAAHPIFYGAWDWHSAAENHWLLTCLLEANISGPVKEQIAARLNEAFTEQKAEIEAESFKRLPAFECPYGIAWYLKLVAALEASSEPTAATWARNLEVLTITIEACVSRWLDKLNAPHRNGLHSQTAFPLKLLYETATARGPTARGQADLAQRLSEKAVQLYGSGLTAMMAFEPQPYDFLSPSLSEAELMASVLDTDGFRSWFQSYGLPMRAEGWAVLTIPEIRDEEKYGLGCHLIGLALSRAWALEKIASVLPEAITPHLRALADAHRTSVENCILDPAFIISHWVPCYAWYHANVREACRGA